jgi:protein TonB
VAFEAYRNQARPGATRVRRVMFLVAALLHGGIISGGVAYSYWHVDELTAPTLRVTFISAAPPPPPPPPPPPAGGGGVKKKVALKPKAVEVPIVTPKPTEIVQPRERPAPVKKTFRKHEDEEEEEDEPAGVKGGVKGGVSGGTIGGTIGGTVGGTPGGTIGGVVGSTAPAGPVAPKFLPPNIAEANKLSGADPDVPVSMRRAGAEYVVQTKLCISREGTVESVTILKGADRQLDESVVKTVKSWRFRPYLANGAPVPWCSFKRFLFNFK